MVTTQDVTITAEPRSTFGKKVKALRRQGLVPARVTTRSGPDLFVQLDAHTFEAAYHRVGMSGTFELTVAGKSLHAMVQHLQRNPINMHILHADLIEVSLHRRVNAEVPLVFAGTAPAQRLGTGVVLHQAEMLMVRGVPTVLPRALEVDVSGLSEVGQHILARDVELPERVELVSDPDTVLASVARPVVEVPEVTAAPKAEAAPEAEEKPEEQAEAAAEEERSEGQAE